MSNVYKNRETNINIIVRNIMHKIAFVQSKKIFIVLP